MSASPPVLVGPSHALRHPLGLPAGSVRAILALMVLGLLWTLVLLPPEREVQVPVYLYYLMFLILGHFFAAHGHTIANPQISTASPLHLPRGSIRFLIVIGFIGVLGYHYYRYQSWENLMKQPLLEQAYLPLILVGAFFLGVFTSRVLGRILHGPQGPPAWLQDVQAWLALLATLGLVAEFVIHVMINPTLEPEKQLHLPHWQTVLASITSFYFGARS